MDLLFNELSLHGQFTDVPSFRESVRQLMKVKEVSRRHSREFYCSTSLSGHTVIAGKLLPQVAALLPADERRVLLSWVSRGPFWDSNRLHDSDDWYEYRHDVVTDTSLAEAVYHLMLSMDRMVVSIEPSDFLNDPLEIDFVIDDSQRTTYSVSNCWKPEVVDRVLSTLPAPVVSWSTLERCSRVRFELLRFSDQAFHPLKSEPFNIRVAEQLLARLGVLHRLRQSFDANGNRTQEGHELVRQHFSGGRAWFSDSSDSEKHRFASDLTFAHPERSGEALSCTWHAKINHPPYRVHFSWPIVATEPVYVTYLGPKITKR